MKEKTFFILAAFVFVLMVGFFSIQLLSLQEDSCYVYFDFECDAYAQLLCGSHEYVHRYAGGVCEDEKCRGTYEIYCGWDGPYSYYTDDITCYDDFSPTCAND